MICKSQCYSIPIPLNLLRLVMQSCSMPGQGLGCHLLPMRKAAHNAMSHADRTSFDNMGLASRRYALNAIVIGAQGCGREVRTAGMCCGGASLACVTASSSERRRNSLFLIV